MKPTEQDKELREKVADALRTGYHRIAETKVINNIMQLITADRKRVALEELEKAFGSGERGGMDNWGRSVNIYLRKRIAELKAQQEEVK